MPKKKRIRRQDFRSGLARLLRSTLSPFKMKVVKNKKKYRRNKKLDNE